MVHVIGRELSAIPKRYLNAKTTGQLPRRRSGKFKQGAISMFVMKPVVRPELAKTVRRVLDR